MIFLILSRYSDFYGLSKIFAMDNGEFEDCSAGDTIFKLMANLCWNSTWSGKKDEESNLFVKRSIVVFWSKLETK